MSANGLQAGGRVGQAGEGVTSVDGVAAATRLTHRLLLNTLGNRVFFIPSVFTRSSLRLAMEVGMAAACQAGVVWFILLFR